MLSNAVPSADPGHPDQTRPDHTSVGQPGDRERRGDGLGFANTPEKEKTANIWVPCVRHEPWAFPLTQTQILDEPVARKCNPPAKQDCWVRADPDCREARKPSGHGRGAQACSGRTHSGAISLSPRP